MRWRADESRIIRLPVQRQALLAETLLASEVLERRVLRVVTAQIATELGKVSDLAAWLASLPLESVGLDELHDVAAPGSEDGIPDDVRQADICALVHEELGQLREKQADVIRRRFGIGFEAEMTLEEVGRIYGVTRERIRQIEAKGFRMLMHPARCAICRRRFDTGMMIRNAPPYAEAMIESLRGLGYTTATALADIIDNSIAAATEVDIRFEWAGVDSWIRVTDNGAGMNDVDLETAMRLGQRSARRVWHPIWDALRDGSQDR